MLDGVKAKREPRARRTLVGICGLVIPEIILAEEPELLVSRSDRTGDVGSDAGFQAGLDLLAVVVAHIRHGIERTAEDFFSLQRHRAEPGPVARIVGHVVGYNEFVLTVHCQLHVVADLGAASLAELHGPTFWIREGELSLAARL